ncbi:hypothetical protein EDB81DRAFT_904749 [Dactylonectria macrodidyma]|uniref:Heterokaryon incompatibility domain-containing protein n=1 Tax=Dactylonectria macrodidyma TaxID=307937 RepID=A0A9P9IUF1_9HYPO|nr:hypothetical protein EDB81DRAFT_904749 [Dactylonectria macrodidyma]
MGDLVEPYDPGIPGVDWKVNTSPGRLEDIKRLMRSTDPKVTYLWADCICICINQADNEEKAVEIPKVYEYYKSANKCHILVHLEQVWDPQGIVDNLRFIDHILSHMGGAALAREARLTENLTNMLNSWENTTWVFPVSKEIARSAAIELGGVDLPAFQEMLLGKNIAMWGINHKTISYIGELETWMNLATRATDKAHKVQAWIELPRVLKPNAVNVILRVIEDDKVALQSLQVQAKGISSARTDVINGGPTWWYDNHRGISKRILGNFHGQLLHWREELLTC